MAKEEDNETPEEHYKKLITLEKNCDFKDVQQEDLLISKIITSITDKKLRVKLIREKILDMKTTVELLTQNSYDRRHKQSTISPVLAKDKEIKQELFQKFKQHNIENNETNRRKIFVDSADNRTGPLNVTARQKR